MANKAKLLIGLIKEAVRKDMKETDYPLDFWDYFVECWDRINNITAKRTFSLHGSNTYTSLIGKEGDISNLCQYKCHNWCYYRKQKECFIFNREVFGRILGPATGAGNDMAQWILNSNGYIVPRRTLLTLHVYEIYIPEEQRKQKCVGALIERRWGTYINPPLVSTTRN